MTFFLFFFASFQKLVSSSCVCSHLVFTLLTTRLGQQKRLAWPTLNSFKFLSSFFFFFNVIKMQKISN